MNSTITLEQEDPAVENQVQPCLETERLLLRPLVASDAPELQRQVGHFAIADTTLNIPYPYPEGAAETFIAAQSGKFAAGEAVTLAITLKGKGRLVGVISLGIARRFHQGELGYWIANGFWNQGYATEAGHAIVDYGFAQCALHKIKATYLARNPASGRVMEKLGLVPEGLLRDHVLKWDRFEDIVICGLIRPG